MSAKTVEDGVEADTQRKSQKKCQSQCKREIPYYAVEAGHDGEPMVGMLTLEEYMVAPEEILAAAFTPTKEATALVEEWRNARKQNKARSMVDSALGEGENAEGEGEKMEETSGTPKHYAMGIQPVDYISSNGLDFFEGNVVKYVTRHKYKNGAEDIRKAMHYLKMILEKEYGESYG